MRSRWVVLSGILLLLFGIILTLGGAFLHQLAALGREARYLRERITNQSRALEEAEIVAENLEAFEVEVGKLRSKVDPLARILPLAPEEDAYLERVRRLAQLVRVDLTLSSEGTRTELLGCPATAFPAELCGTSAQVREFISKEVKLSRISRWTSSTSSAAGPSGCYSFKVYLFYLPRAPSSLADPPSEPTVSPSTVWLWPLTTRVANLRQKLGVIESALSDLSPQLRLAEELVEEKQRMERRVTLIDELFKGEARDSERLLVSLGIGGATESTIE